MYLRHKSIKSTNVIWGRTKCLMMPMLELGNVSCKMLSKRQKKHVQIVRVYNSWSRQGANPRFLLKLTYHVQWDMIFRKPKFAILILITFCFQNIIGYTDRDMLLFGELKCISYLIVDYLFITNYCISQCRKVSI